MREETSKCKVSLGKDHVQGQPGQVSGTLSQDIKCITDHRLFINTHKNE